MSDDTKSLLDQLKDDDILSNVDNIIDQLKIDNSDISEPKAEPINLSEENLGKFILDHGGKLVNDSTSLVSRLKSMVGASGDPEEVAALASLVAATSTAIESLNKIYTQNKKIQAARELKSQEIEGKKEIAKIKNEGDNTPGLLIANREEIFAMLLQGKKKDEIIIDAEITS